MGGEEPRLIKEHVAQATAQQHAERHEQQEVVHPLGREWALLARPKPALLDQRLDIEAAEQQTGHVGKAVPFYRERPDPEGDRVDGRVRAGEDAQRAELSAGGTAVKAPQAGNPRASGHRGGASGRLEARALHQHNNPRDHQMRGRRAKRCARLPTERAGAMTQTNNRFLDELARLMTDAAGAAQGMRRDFETMVKAQGERLLREMDVVQREEFEAVKEMAAKAREENEALSARLAALEAELAGLKRQP